MPGNDSCQACGGALSPDTRFCPSCGHEQVAGSRGAADTIVSPPTPEAPTVLSHGSLARITADRLSEATTGEFEILERVGHGAMGSVYLARDIALSRRVAIKVISPHLLQDESMVARFRLEAQTVAALRHPNIVNLYAVREIGDLHFFIMDFIDGTSLRSLIKEHGPLDLAVTRALLHQIGSALSYAHQRGRGVIHRDVKPANIMIDREGNAVVMDFGISKVGASQSGLTQTGATIGTPEYMSPEQCMDKELTGASDQYALGIVAHEMLTGAVPFKGPTYVVMMAHAEGSPPLIREVRPDCPPEVEATIARMLAKAPEDRFADLAEAVAALGGRPLGHHDPIRDAIVALVESVSSETAGLDESSPLSPVPASRELGPSVNAASEASGQPPAAPEARTEVDSTGPPPATPPDELGGHEARRADHEAAQQSRESEKRRSSRAWVAIAAVIVVALGVAQAVRSSRNNAEAGIATLSLAPVAGSVPVGDTLRLTATALARDGTLQASAGAVWTSSDEHVATVDETGIVIARGAGSTRISVRLGDAATSTEVRVRDLPAVVSADPPPDGGEGEDPEAAVPQSTPEESPAESVVEPVVPEGPVVASVRIVGGKRVLRVGATTPVSAMGLTAAGTPVTDAPVEWRSSDPAVADVRRDELVAAGAGSATLTATVEGVSASVDVIVRALPTRDEVIALLQDRFVDLLGRSDTDAIERLLGGGGRRGGRQRELIDRMREASFTAQLTRLQDVTAAGTGATVDFDVGLGWRDVRGERKRGATTFRATLQPTESGWRVAGVNRLPG